MDESGLDPTVHREALLGLERINRASRTVAPVWRSIEELVAAVPQPAGQPLSVLDVACGAGDLAIGLAERARQQQNIQVKVEGCDISATAVAHAQARALERSVDVRFFEYDVLQRRLSQRYDVITCSLFLHHLEDEQAVQLLVTLREWARQLVVITDLDRSWRGFALAWVGARLLSRSPVVHVDAARSVRAAFTSDEIRELASRVGFTSFTVEAQWPCRWRLVAWQPRGWAPAEWISGSATQNRTQWSPR